MTPDPVTLPDFIDDFDSHSLVLTNCTESLSSDIIIYKCTMCQSLFLIHMYNDEIYKLKAIYKDTGISTEYLMCPQVLVNTAQNIQEQQ